MSGHEYANELERRFSSLPGIAQDALREPFTWMNDVLRQVAGEPQVLLAAGSRYVQVAEAVHELRQQQVRDRAALAEHWKGAAHDAFDAAMQRVETQLDQLAEAIRTTKDVLEVGARACVEGANMIVDLVAGLILAVASTWIIGAALSVLSFGATAAAAVAYWIAKALKVVADVLRVLERTAMVLRRVAAALFRLRALLRKVRDAFRYVKGALEESRASVKAARGLPQIVGERTSFALQKSAVSGGIWLATGTLVAIPGMAGQGYQAAQDYLDARHDADQAEDRAGQ